LVGQTEPERSIHRGTEPDYQPSACKHRHIDCLINMPDEKVTSLDDLADEAFELLGELVKTGQSTAFLSKLVEKAF
jgi:hypothetical protein